jgi:hypothetical protein
VAWPPPQVHLKRMNRHFSMSVEFRISIAGMIWIKVDVRGITQVFRVGVGFDGGRGQSDGINAHASCARVGPLLALSGHFRVS